MMKKRFLSLILTAILLVLTLMGCGTSETGVNKIYYISTDKTSIVSEAFYFEKTLVDDRVQEMLDALSRETASVEYMQTVPAGVEIEEWELDEGVLSLYLNEVYSELDPLTEVLVRAAIVRSLTQIVGVDSVAFYVDNKPLENAQGVALGALTAERFIDDFGQETDALLNTTLKLYFASADGAKVVPETRTVYYSSNVPLEKLVIDQLLKGPKNSDLLASIPAETKLVSVSVTDGICYVNFDSAFETVITGVSESSTVYSVVNSLTELSTINQVQITVAGEIPHMANLEADLSQPLSKFYGIIGTATKADGINDFYDEEVKEETPTPEPDPNEEDIEEM